MVVYQAAPKNKFNSFEYCVGHRPSPLGQVNSHELLLEATHSLLYRNCMQKPTI